MYLSDESGYEGESNFEGMNITLPQNYFKKGYGNQEGNSKFTMHVGYSFLIFLVKRVTLKITESIKIRKLIFTIPFLPRTSHI